MINLGGTSCNNLKDLCIPMKLVRLIKMCLKETYSRVPAGKHLSNIFPIRNGLKQEDALSLLLFDFTLEKAIRRVQVHHDVLKLNGTHQLLIYAGDNNKLGWCVHTVKNTEVLVVAGGQIGIEVNANKTKCMVMSRDQNEGWRRNTKTDNTSLEREEEFKYLGTSLRFKILFRKILRADRSQGMLAIIRCRIFCLPFPVQKYKD